MSLILFFAFLLGVPVIDQITKLIVDANMTLGQTIPLWKDVFHITYIHNEGAAMGMLSGHRWVFLVLSTVGIVLMCLYLWYYAKTTLSRVGLSLVIAGGIGNMIDRMVLGFVVDFIDFCAFDFWVWVFNIADAAVCVGAAIFMLDLVLELVREMRGKKADAGDGNGTAN